MVLRDRDANTAWAAASDGTLEERRAYAQNWRGDVAAVLSDNGKMVEWVKYSAYGVPFALPAGDVTSDGSWTAADSALITGTYDVRKDAELDGDLDAADSTHASSIVPGGGYQTLGRGVLSSTGVNNRKGYAGYERDPAFGGAGRHLHHVRYRVYDADLGRWLQRDPQGYSDGMSLYAYVQAMAIIAADPMGADDVRQRRVRDPEDAGDLRRRWAWARAVRWRNVRDSEGADAREWERDRADYLRWG